MNELDRLRADVAARAKAAAESEERMRELVARKKSQDEETLGALAKKHVDEWARCFRQNLGVLSRRSVELHYISDDWLLFWKRGYKWTSQARYNHAPSVSLWDIAGNEGALFTVYASQVSVLLGSPLHLSATWHSYPYDHHVPHKKGSEFHGYTDEYSHGYFSLFLLK